VTIDWDRYTKCPACPARLGEPCVQLSGFVVDGRVAVGLEGGVVAVEAEKPHGGRELRAVSRRG
jgi:hypothetical protein